jgi:hypothetical protein
MFITYKNSILTAGAVSLLSVGNWLLASPSYAISLVDFATWQAIGDVNQETPNEAQANSGTLDTVLTGGGTGSLEEFLEIDAGSLDILDPDAAEFRPPQGSAIKTLFTNVQVGDTFSFNWQLNLEPDFPDKAFVTINGLIIPLNDVDSGLNGSFQYLFSVAGNYTLGIGIVDVRDAGGESQLIVSNGKLQPVPEPLTLLGIFTGLGCGLVMRSRFGKQC